MTGLRPVELRADRARVRLQRGAHQRGVMVLRRAGQRAVVGEGEVLAVVGARVGKVVAGIGRDAREPPRVLPHQLGVRIDGKLCGFGRGTGVGDREAEQGSAAPVGHEVRARHAQAGRARQVIFGVTPATRELRRGTDPVAVEPEPDAVDQLQWRRPYAAHLAGDVPSVGVEPPVLEADRVGPGPGCDLPPVCESSGVRQLRCRRCGRRSCRR